MREFRYHGKVAVPLGSREISSGKPSSALRRASSSAHDALLCDAFYKIVEELLAVRSNHLRRFAGHRSGIRLRGKRWMPWLTAAARRACAQLLVTVAF